MPLQTSGPIKISEIKAELGSSSNSLRNLSAAAGFSTPDAMSEFYGYPPTPAYSNDFFYKNDGVNDYIEYTNGNGGISFGDVPITVSFWVRQNSGGNKNAQMINFAPGFSKDNRIMIDYNVNNSKLRFNHRSDATNTMKEYYLNTGVNQAVSGVSSEWTASDRGVVNQLGFTMLTFTYDPGLPGLDGLTVYWNEDPLTHNAYVQGTRSSLPTVNARVGENIHTTASAGCANMDFDEIKVYDQVLSATDIVQLYNSGQIVDSSQLSLPAPVIEITFENGVTDANNYFAGAVANNGGAVAGY